MHNIFQDITHSNYTTLHELVSDMCGNVAAAGQAVFGQVAGSLASHVLADSSLLVHMPLTVTFDQASTMPTVFMTADLAFNHAMHAAPGTHALVHAAAGMSFYIIFLFDLSER